MIWKHSIDLKLLNETSKNSLSEHLGIEFIDFGEDYLIAKMPVDKRTVQPYGILHGGASVALAETLGSVAGLLSLKDPNSEMTVGVEINANHLKPALSGFVFGTVKPVRVGKTIQVWNIEIRNDQNQLTCVSRITLAVIPNNTGIKRI